MKIVVFGTGGVGGFFGSKLALGGQEVWFLARGGHLDAMLRSGLRVHSTEGSWTISPERITSDPEKPGAADVVMFCVKSYHTEPAAEQLAPLLSEETIVISLQNGIANEGILQRIIPRGTVFGGVANIYSVITAPGVVTQTAGPRKLTFGPLRREPPPIMTRAAHLLAAMTGAHINAELSEDIRLDLWKKFIFISSVGGLTALTQLSLDEILSVAETRSLLVRAMQECESIALAQGIRIEPEFINATLEVLRGFNPDTRSSLYYDLVHGKPMEVEALPGTVVRLGRRLGIATPVHETIFASLLPYHLKHGGTTSHKP